MAAFEVINRLYEALTLILKFYHDDSPTPAATVVEPWSENQLQTNRELMIYRSIRVFFQSSLKLEDEIFEERNNFSFNEK